MLLQDCFFVAVFVFGAVFCLILHILLKESSVTAHFFCHVSFKRHGRLWSLLVIAAVKCYNSNIY